MRYGLRPGGADEHANELIAASVFATAGFYALPLFLISQTSLGGPGVVFALIIAAFATLHQVRGHGEAVARLKKYELEVEGRELRELWNGTVAMRLSLDELKSARARGDGSIAVFTAKRDVFLVVPSRLDQLDELRALLGDLSTSPLAILEGRGRWVLGAINVAAFFAMMFLGNVVHVAAAGGALLAGTLLEMAVGRTSPFQHAFQGVRPSTVAIIAALVAYRIFRSM